VNQIIEQKIKAARQEVDGTNAPPERKDGLQSLLDQAYATANGSPDKLGEMANAISLLIIHNVRAEIREGARMQAAIDTHQVVCRATRVPRTFREAMNSAAAQYPLLTILLLGWAAERGWLGKLLEVFH